MGVAPWIGTKISATLVDFGEPLLKQLPPDASLELRHGLVNLIVTQWNAHVMAATRGQPQPLAQLRDTLFVDDPRAIGHWEVRDTGPGEWNIRCDARMPPQGVVPPPE